MNEPLWVVPWLTQTNPRWRRPPSLIPKNINNSGLDKDICTKFHGKMHNGRADMQRWPRDQKSKPEVNSRDVIK